MTLDEAIEILNIHQCDMPPNEVPDLIAATKLGIEALDQLKKEREQKVGFWRDRLPGETKE